MKTVKPPTADSITTAHIAIMVLIGVVGCLILDRLDELEHIMH